MRDDSQPDTHGHTVDGEGTIPEDAEVVESDVSWDEGDDGPEPDGPSPLDNHVPREYALGASEAEFVARFKREVPERAEYFDTVPEIVGWVTEQHHFDDTVGIEIPDHVPTLDEVREWANGVYVRGTLRHRENDHYMENIGDEWHIARTHTMEVFTADIAPDVGITAQYD